MRAASLPYPRDCEHCGAAIVQRVNETRQSFHRRRFCNRRCANHRGTERDRFSRFVWKTETCWIWLGKYSKLGYGFFKIGGHYGKWVQSHRVAWRMAFGESRQPMVLHHCDNPACVRPDHLFEGDALANTADMIAKGRGAWQKRA